MLEVMWQGRGWWNKAYQCLLPELCEGLGERILFGLPGTYSDHHTNL